MKDTPMEKTHQACFRVPVSKWKAIKHYAVANDIIMQDLMTDMLDVWMEARGVTLIEEGMQNDR